MVDSSADIACIDGGGVEEELYCFLGELGGEHGGYRSRVVLLLIIVHEVNVVVLQWWTILLNCVELSDYFATS